MQNSKTEAQNILQEKEEQQSHKATAKKYIIVLILIGMIVGLSILNPSFLSYNNILNLLTQTSIYGILSLAVFMVIVSGGIDLSLGSMLALSGIIGGAVSQTTTAIDKVFPSIGMAPLWVTFLVVMLVGAVLGAINGGLISYFRIPPFIATLGMFTAARGAALMVSSGKPVSNVNPQINILGDRIFGYIPVPVLIYGVVIIIIGVIMKYTSFGKSVYAIGGNREAAKVSGIKVKRNLTFIYMIAGVLSGVAALVYMGRTGGSIQPAAATGYELTAIAGATIGGTSHSGGIGTVWGAVVGALILGVLVNGFTLLGINAYVQQIVQGIIIVAAVLVDMRQAKA